MAARGRPRRHLLLVSEQLPFSCYSFCKGLIASRSSFFAHRLDHALKVQHLPLLLGRMDYRRSHLSSVPLFEPNPQNVSPSNSNLDNAESNFSHQPVLLEEIAAAFRSVERKRKFQKKEKNREPKNDTNQIMNSEQQSELTFVDATFGRGGHTTALLERFPSCRVIGIDCDLAALTSSNHESLKRRFGHRFVSVHGRFGNLEMLVRGVVGSNPVDAILFDLGVSSPQLDQSERGFSFRRECDGPLDMRMDQTQTLTAEHVVNHMSADELARIIYYYGEEKFSRQIGRELVERRKRGRIMSTWQLAEIVRETIDRCTSHNYNRKNNTEHHHKIDSATRTFQALRIYVNDEINQLQRGLAQAEALLAPFGQLAVISFHSLEDREVKNFLAYCSGKKKTFSFTNTNNNNINYNQLEQNSRENNYFNRNENHSNNKKNNELYENLDRKPSFYVGSKSHKVILPSEDEISRNPRARSAKLRIATRTNAPPLFPSFV